MQAPQQPIQDVNYSRLFFELVSAQFPTLNNIISGLLVLAGAILARRVKQCTKRGSRKDRKKSKHYSDSESD